MKTDRGAASELAQVRQRQSTAKANFMVLFLLRERIFSRHSALRAARLFALVATLLALPAPAPAQGAALATGAVPPPATGATSPPAAAARSIRVIEIKGDIIHSDMEKDWLEQ